MLEIEKFIDIVRKLRSEEGCPWDRAQTHLSLRRCLIEESGEFLDALENQDFEAMKEELGDLLLQVVLHAQIASENGAFDLEDVARAANQKLISRHTHVFSEKTAASPAEALQNWEESKKKEKGAQEKRKSQMDGVPRSMPALARAQKTLSKAAKNGFEWSSKTEMLAKIEEEWQEILAALKNNDQENLAEEAGDYLLAFVSFCRFFELEAEESLQAAIAKFMKRFRRLEEMQKRSLGASDKLRYCDLAEFWQKSKE